MRTRPAFALAVGLAVAIAGCGSGTGGSASVPDVVAARRAAGIADCPASTDSAALPDGLPDIALSCLGGDSVVRLAGLRGRPMVVNLWAQWCAPCRAEARFLADYARQSVDEVMMMGLNFNDPQPELAVAFAHQVGWTYPQLADPDKTSEGPLRVPGIPLTLLVDDGGHVVSRHAGPFASTTELAGWVAAGLGAR